MNDTLHFPDEPPHDLPPDLQQAVRRALAATHCLRPPPRYDPTYWREEREAIANYAVWRAAQAYHTETGISREAFAQICAFRAIYGEWQRLWRRDKAVVAMPVDEETGEAVEFADEEALETIGEHLLCGQVREALAQLPERERCLIEWYFGEGLSERVIAAQLGCSHVAVHTRLRRAWQHLCQALGVEREFPRQIPKNGENRGKKGQKRGRIEVAKTAGFDRREWWRTSACQQTKMREEDNGTWGKRETYRQPWVVATAPTTDRIVASS